MWSVEGQFLVNGVPGKIGFSTRPGRRPFTFRAFPSYILGPMPEKEPSRQFKVGDKIRVNLHHGKIEDAVVKAIVEDADGVKLQIDVVGLDVTALIDPRQVVDD
jgi:transcription antitermination factor NusG